MEHDRTGLSDDEQRAFEELTSAFGEVRVPRAASAAGALRRSRLWMLAAVAVLGLAAVGPLLVFGPWVSFAVFCGVVFAVNAGWRGWVAAARASTLVRYASSYSERANSSRSR